MAEKIISAGAIQIGDHLTVDQAMQLAIFEAQKGAPFVSPNPLVGCVVLDSENRFLASGYHHRYGTDHAEVDAFKKLSADQLVQSQFIVTLEPCAHEGKTPSCAKALAKMKLKKVIYGLQDPNPLVAGSGARIIQDAGIACEEYKGLEKNNIEDLAEVFLKNFRHKKVFVAAKVATSLDGQMALKTGESQWITTPASREYVHELRSYYDAIVVGRGTVEIDNPSLNIRHPKIQKTTKLIIIDPSGKIIEQIAKGRQFKFLQAHDLKNIYFAVHQPIATSYQTILFSNLNDLLEKVWNLSVKSVFIEGGAKTYSEFLKADLIDRLYVFQNTSIIGNANGRSWTESFGIQDLNKKKQLRNISVKRFEADVMITGRLDSEKN